MADLEALLTAELFGYLLIFCRIGAAMMVLPGFGEAFVTPRARLAISILLTIVLAPVMPAPLPPMPDQLVLVIGPIVGEVIVGLFFGLFARTLVAAVETAGMIISFQMSLANAVAFNPALATQGSIIGSFLSITALVLIFASDTHHLIILALADTYILIPPGEPPPIGDMADTMARAVAAAFSIAMRLAAPFVLLGLVFNLAMGIIARLMPQVQIFFVGIPLQLLGGLAVTATVLTSLMAYWLTRFQDAFTNGILGF